MYGSYTSHLIRQSNNRSFKEDVLKQLRVLITRAIIANVPVYITTHGTERVRIADCYYFSGKIIFYHGDQETGKTIYKEDGTPIVNSIQPDTVGYYEVFHQVKAFIDKDYKPEQ